MEMEMGRGAEKSYGFKGEKREKGQEGSLVDE